MAQVSQMKGKKKQEKRKREKSDRVSLSISSQWMPLLSCCDTGIPYSSALGAMLGHVGMHARAATLPLCKAVRTSSNSTSAALGRIGGRIGGRTTVDMQLGLFDPCNAAAVKQGREDGGRQAAGAL